MTTSLRNALVLTGPAGAPLRERAAKCADVLVGRGDLEARWLSPDEAWELAFDARADDDIGALLAEVRAQLVHAAIDANIVSADSNRRKRLFVADMDSTMIGQECIDELADYAGLRSHVAAITDRAMRGEIAFEPALRERVALLKGLPVSVIDEVLRERITLMPGGKTLVATMRANRATTCLVSGGFTGFVDRVAAIIGFDESRANILETEGDRLAGRVREPILGREAKLATLVELRSRLNLTPEQTLAVGDGANDLAMLGEAGLGVAYCAKPAVAEAAAARIDHCDLTALLYLQGYRREEFVA